MPARNHTRVRIKVEDGGDRLVANVRYDDGGGFRFCAGAALPGDLDGKWLDGAYAGVTAASAAGDAVDVVRLAVASRAS